ncbi:cytochrome c [Varunaivibrio sulfuroxidans]|uniref:Cbb3-type cytochrome c oxidase subunit III n=1 Tax=Varunaivibrio sulfuroxidans TaxID=1773489 RepID=A0A4R3JGG4_9PROT|nr:cytochrome c [Varunaivibrio sulfuroxidans]TCS65024.1 cbb3-type cytochrome c oxidase subunit III [Varunaivibrio sulfuroxidans]WES29686.1 cytochrome c [Varunaivibrio sulfuroxidans]
MNKPEKNDRIPLAPPRQRSPVRIFIAMGVLSFAAVWGLYYAHRATPLTTRAAVPHLTPEGRRGQRLFNEKCASCHGPNGTGSRAGPPLIHPMYRLGHPGGDGIRRAIVQGVAPHHWNFGAMPAQPDLGAQNIGAIIAFIQEMQRANHLY